MEYKNEHIKGVLEHKEKVAQNLLTISNKLMERAFVHDNSKFSVTEHDGFLENTQVLNKLEYGTQEYKDQLKKLKPVLDHHYTHNSHHPEYYENGIKDMELLDIIEMVCDWKASVERHETGDIDKSMEINKERFNIDDQTFKYMQTILNDLKNRG